MQDAVLTPPSFLTLSGISKRYGGVRALEGVDFACERGKIHAVLGENGAGKSTLIKIIAGVVQPDTGGMRLAGVTRTCQRWPYGGAAAPLSLSPAVLSWLGSRFLLTDSPLTWFF